MAKEVTWTQTQTEPHFLSSGLNYYCIWHFLKLEQRINFGYCFRGRVWPVSWSTVQSLLAPTPLLQTIPNCLLAWMPILLQMKDQWQLLLGLAYSVPVQSWKGTSLRNKVKTLLVFPLPPKSWGQSACYFWRFKNALKEEEDGWQHQLSCTRSASRSIIQCHLFLCVWTILWQVDCL